MSPFKSLFLPLAVITGLITPSYGSITSGVLNFSGTSTNTFDSATFACNQLGDLTGCGPSTGDFLIAGSTGDFSTYNATYGQIDNFNNATQPLNQPFSLPNFITFDLNSDQTIELTFLPLGTDTVSNDCSGLQHCTPLSGLLVTGSNPSGISGFNLDQSGNETDAVFAVTGILHDISGQTAVITGTFTYVFSNFTPADVDGFLQTGSTATYNGQLTVGDISTPEPASIVLIGLGLAGISLRKRRVTSPNTSSESATPSFPRL